jgi:diguanylate cyclase (GGDEF)-like protein
MASERQASIAKALTLVVAAAALVGGGYHVGYLALWVAVPALAGMGWRSPAAFLTASGLGALGLAGAILMHNMTSATLPDETVAVSCLATLGFTAWAGWLFLAAARERGYVIRQATEALTEDLVKLREGKIGAEKSLIVHENRRKRYSRLQESATAMASSLELEKLADLALAQAALLLHGVPLNLTLIVLDSSGKEMLCRCLDLGGGIPAAEGAACGLGDDALNAWVLARGTSLVIKDLEKDFRFRGLDMQALKGRSFHLSPLLSTQGQVTGLVRAESIQREAMDQEDGRLLESLVVLASLAFENAKLYRETQDLAVTDGLTKLLLRRVLMERLDQELVRARETEGTASLVLLDIDHFKQVNDTYGHPAGDAVLREVAARVKRSVRDVDVCGRYGGEEFVVILPQTPLDGALLVAERIREAVKAKPFELRGDERTITVSLGVAVYPQHADQGQSLIEAADSALYRSKENGRDRVSPALEAS